MDINETLATCNSFSSFKVEDYSVMFYFTSPIHLCKSVQPPLAKEWKNKNPTLASYPHQYLLLNHILLPPQKLVECWSKKRKAILWTWKFTILLWCNDGEGGGSSELPGSFSSHISPIHWLFSSGGRILCWDYLLWGWWGNWVDITFIVYTSIRSIWGF